MTIRATTGLALLAGWGLATCTAHPPAADSDILICDEVSSTNAMGVNPERFYHRYRWDAVRRVQSIETRADSEFTGAPDRAWRYTHDRRLLVTVGYGTAYSEKSQTDLAYDVRDNVSESRFSYPESPSVDAPSQAEVYVGAHYDNLYTETGRLLASTETPYGPGVRDEGPVRTEYEEDELGRCIHRLTMNPGPFGRLDVSYAYDTQDRVVEARVRRGTSESSGCQESVKRTVYGVDGRVALESEWRCGTTEGEPDSTTVYTYASDGSTTIEYSSGGEPPHSVTTRSPGCLVMDGEIGRPADARCRVP